MNILGFDTSTSATSACLIRDDGRQFEVLPDPLALGAPPAHARELMPALASVLADGGHDWEELDAVALGIGPGTFTGLRIGVATARGLARAHNVELRPVSSLAALARGVEAGLRLPLIDAKRGEVFAALYENGEERWPRFAARAEEVAERAHAAGVKPRAVGDGSVRFRGVLEAAGIEVEPDGSPAHVVRGLHVCRLAQAARAMPPEAVVPEYLRLPDATPSP